MKVVTITNPVTGKESEWVAYWQDDVVCLEWRPSYEQEPWDPPLKERSDIARSDVPTDSYRYRAGGVEWREACDEARRIRNLITKGESS